MREDILNEAKRLICGARNAQYGEPTQDFQRTADLWSTEFGELLAEGRRFEPHHVALAMILLKASRIAWSPGKRDHWVDIAGYAACGAECATEDVERDQKFYDEYRRTGEDETASWDHVEVNPFSVDEWVVSKPNQGDAARLFTTPRRVRAVEGPLVYLLAGPYRNHPWHYSLLELADVQADPRPDSGQTMDATVYPDLG